MLFGTVPEYRFCSIPKGLRTHIPPMHIRAPPISINTTQISPRHPPDIPQTPPDISREHDMPTDAEGLCQTYSNNSCQCLGVSGGVSFCLLASVGMLCYLEMPWGCLGDVWGVSEGYLSGIHRNWRLSDAFGGYVGSQSLQYGAKTLFRHSLEGQNFCHLTILRH